MAQALSVDVSRIAIVGNPNAGKTSLFNALTGLQQKTGNYAGVTVERHEGVYQLDGLDYQVVDIPGLYSLIPMSEDEIIATRAIRGEGEEPSPDLFVCAIDVTNLERNLYFFAQIAQLGKPVVAALTMSDLLVKSGVKLDRERLQAELGVPVVTINSNKRAGLGSLKHEIREALKGESTRWAMLDTPGDRYDWAARVAAEVLDKSEMSAVRKHTDRIDQVLTHRVWGMLIFAAVMYLMFQCIYTFSGPLMDVIDSTFGWLKDLAGRGDWGPEWLRSLVQEGLIGGIGSVVIFLPQILILFGFIAALEGSGYLARASFLMDRLLGWCGLNGKAFIPLLSSFACAIPGIMAARIMPDNRSRLATILIAPLMSCSARLPVYVLLIGAIIEPQFGPLVAGLTLFGMHLLGLVVAVCVMVVLNKRLLKGHRLPFLLEMPPYQWPRPKDIGRAMMSKAGAFLKTAGTIIVVMSIALWALLYFPRADRVAFEASASPTIAAERMDSEFERYQLEQSYLGRFSRSIAPIFEPAGFDWRITTAVVAAFPAREVMVASLGIIFNLSGDVDDSSTDLRDAMRTATWPDGRLLFTPWTSFALMAFFALCCQCMSTLAIIKRETNGWKYPIIVFSYMTALSWVVAVAINQIGLLVSR